jgi:hypothetical protein
MLKRSLVSEGCGNGQVELVVQARRFDGLAKLWSLAATLAQVVMSRWADASRAVYSSAGRELIGSSLHI